MRQRLVQGVVITVRATRRRGPSDPGMFVAPMKPLTLLLPLVLLFACSKPDAGTQGAGKTPAADSPAPQKSLVDKAKEAAANVKEAATTPLDDKSLTRLAAVAKDLQAELGKDGAAQAKDMKTLLAKAKDIKVIAEKNGLKVSELTGLVARLGTVMSAVKSGNVPEQLQADVAAIEKHKELRALFEQ
jgi:hypothetical protein